jgi:cyclophilin family peptidyl-prolyl cis-trans isomerase
MPTLLPPELANPTLEVWEAKAQAAKTPQERFTALHFLNRLKSSKALRALEGLRSEDAATWPKHLHLEAGIATARLNGGEVSAELQAFLDALQKAGKVDLVRAQAARLRLVMGGKEKELLATVKNTPTAELALLDAWSRGSESMKRAFAPNIRSHVLLPPSHLGLSSTATRFTAQGWLPRMLNAYPEDSPEAWEAVSLFLVNEPPRVGFKTGRIGTLNPEEISMIYKFGPDALSWALELSTRVSDPLVLSGLLASLRKGHKDSHANLIREQLWKGTNSIARAAAIEDLAECPAEGELKALAALTWKDREYEAQQTLIQSYERWKLAPERRAELLKPWLDHPNWSCRLEAFKALSKLDPSTPWPVSPAPTKVQAAILRQAERLAEAGKPVRLRLRFSGRRTVVLRLDPTVAPINVANLVILARKGFFNGRRVPRVVPDFVVQMGSPFDTMDGGPGYTVRCENSLNWYGPGSVGMALSGKDTGGSQFFITTNATPHLTGKYTRLGEVEDPDKALPLLDDLELGAHIERVDVIAAKGH